MTFFLFFRRRRLLAKIHALYAEWECEAQANKGRLNLSPEFIIEDFLDLLGLNRWQDRELALFGEVPHE